MLNKRNQTEIEKEKHTHDWKENFNFSEKNCSCGAILVSLQEFERREFIWKKYYEDVKNTPAYIDWLIMRENYYNTKNFEFQAALQRQRERIRNKDWVLRKPPYPDFLYPKYILTAEK